MPNLINWLSQYGILGISALLYYIFFLSFFFFFFFFFFLEFALSIMKTVQTQIRRRMMRRLIWVCTVCLCPFYGTLGINGLNCGHLILVNQSRISKYFINSQ